MYIAAEKVATVNKDYIAISLIEGEISLKIETFRDKVYLNRAEVIELIEKLAKVAEQLPK